MSPAYKKGKERRQADPLAWRIDKLIRRLRPMLSADRFLEINKDRDPEDYHDREEYSIEEYTGTETEDGRGQ